MRFISLPIFFLLFAVATHASQPITEASNTFAFDLYKQLQSGSADQNIFFSPYSISTALAMTREGASGTTLDEMSKVLRLQGFQSSPKFIHLDSAMRRDAKRSGINFSVASKLWPHKTYPLLTPFIVSTQKNFGSNVEALDYSVPENARKTINQWTRLKTNSMIKDLIPSGQIVPLTRLILTNAIYFKGKWETAFKKDRTLKEDFTTLKSKKIQADLMHQLEEVKFFEDEKSVVLELPYKNGEFSFVAAMPTNPTTFAKWEAELSVPTWESWMKNLTTQRVNIALPRFKSEWKSELSKDLIKMGMPSAFDMMKAQFTRMSGNKGVGKDFFISAVIHQAVVDVGEEGTEAAAATAVLMRIGSAVSHTRTFRADRPFVYAIRHVKTGEVLFLGRMADPT